MSGPKVSEIPGERIAKVMARVGVCSRRDAEAMILEGRVVVNGKKIESPALNVTDSDDVRVDGKPLPDRERTRLFRYYKPRGLVTTAKDPEGRPTVFASLPPGMPRVISVGRLDLNSEGLLLLTNDGELARKLELPATAWVRRYRVRIHGEVDPKQLTQLIKGIEVEGVRYGSIEATLDRKQGDNSWLTMSLTEGKNREIRKICGHFGWPVSRLIRVAFGPFQLGQMNPGDIEEVPSKVLREQLSQGKAQTKLDGKLKLRGAPPPRDDKPIRPKDRSKADSSKRDRSEGNRSEGNRSGGDRSQKGRPHARPGAKPPRHAR